VQTCVYCMPVVSAINHWSQCWASAIATIDKAWLHRRSLKFGFLLQTWVREWELYPLRCSTPLRCSITPIPPSQLHYLTSVIVCSLCSLILCPDHANCSFLKVPHAVRFRMEVNHTHCLYCYLHNILLLPHIHSFLTVVFGSLS